MTSRIVISDRCPRCTSRELIRSRRRHFAERIVGALLLPWRCWACDTRFYRFRWVAGHAKQGMLASLR